MWTTTRPRKGGTGQRVPPTAVPGGHVPPQPSPRACPPTAAPGGQVGTSRHSRPQRACPPHGRPRRARPPHSHPWRAGWHILPQPSPEGLSPPWLPLEGPSPPRPSPEGASLHVCPRGRCADRAPGHPVSDPVYTALPTAKSRTWRESCLSGARGGGGQGCGRQGDPGPGTLCCLTAVGAGSVHLCVDPTAWRRLPRTHVCATALRTVAIDLLTWTACDSYVSRDRPRGWGEGCVRETSYARCNQCQ